MSNALKIFSGENSTELASKISSCLNLSLGNVYHHSFPSGEHYCQFKENIRGCDVFLVQNSDGLLDANNALMQLLIMADAARRASANRITAVCPTFFYQRQDRKDKSQVPISSKLVMDIIESSGINRVISMDLHAPQIAGFTNLPFDVLHFRSTLVEGLEKENVKIDVIMAPDVGAVKGATEFSEQQRLDFAFIVKKRKNDTEVEVSQFVGDVKDKNVLILDDLTESAGTLVNAASCARINGAKNIYAAVTHCALTDIGIKRLTEAITYHTLQGFFASNVTDGPVSSSLVPIKFFDVAPMFAKAINSIHTNESASSLFI